MVKRNVLERPIDVESLDRLADPASGTDEDDEEAALDALIETFGAPQGSEPVGGEAVRPHEFVCSGCHLILHVSRLADRERGLCIECFLPAAPSAP